ncbi:MAG: hypothetical protein V3V78_01230 [Candidatus Woesearchaeota archaeon]
MTDISNILSSAAKHEENKRILAKLDLKRFLYQRPNYPNKDSFVLSLSMGKGYNH